MAILLLSLSLSSMEQGDGGEISGTGKLLLALWVLRAASLDLLYGVRSQQKKTWCTKLVI